MSLPSKTYLRHEVKKTALGKATFFSLISQTRYKTAIYRELVLKAKKTPLFHTKGSTESFVNEKRTTHARRCQAVRTQNDRRLQSLSPPVFLSPHVLGGPHGTLTAFGHSARADPRQASTRSDPADARCGSEAPLRRGRARQAARPPAAENNGSGRESARSARS